jgi:hypothetical protein
MLPYLKGAFASANRFLPPREEFRKSEITIKKQFGLNDEKRRKPPPATEETIVPPCSNRIKQQCINSIFETPGKAPFRYGILLFFVILL